MTHHAGESDRGHLTDWMKTGHGPTELRDLPGETKKQADERVMAWLKKAHRQLGIKEEK